MILLDKFPHIKRTQIISHVKYTNSKISQVCNNPNTKITSLTQNGICNFFKTQKIHNIKYHINPKEDTCESKHVNAYRQKIQDVLITLCFCCERLCFLKQL
jgi:hypothetical protein